MNIKQAIEEQRSVLDKMAENATHLTELLEEARKMDRPHRSIRNGSTHNCIRTKNAVEQINAPRHFFGKNSAKWKLENHKKFLRLY